MARKGFENEYLANRREYSAILDQSNKERKGWQSMAFICVIVALCSIGGVIYIGAQSKIIPLVVTLNDSGVPVRTHLVTDTATTVDERYIKGELAEIVYWLRVVTFDKGLHAQKLDDMKLFFNHDSPGFERVREYIQDSKTSPFKRAENSIVDVAINNVVRLKENIWQVDWTETTRERDGKFQTTEKHKGVISISFLESIDDELKLVNPLGLLIEDFVWSKYF